MNTEKQRSAQDTVRLVLRAVALGMAVAVVVMNVVGVASAETSVMLLGIGLFSLAVGQLSLEE